MSRYGIAVNGIRVKPQWDASPIAVNGCRQIGAPFSIGISDFVAVFECDCGKLFVAICATVKYGSRKSCGCKHVKHGHASHVAVSGEYTSWASMKSRCLCKSDPFFHRYGGRGITICDRWLQSFNEFLNDMGPKPTKKHTLDRIDNDGNYCPENCRWATAKEQARTRSNVILVTAFGETKVVSDWILDPRTLVCKNSLRARLKLGIPPELAMTGHKNAIFKHYRSGKLPKGGKAPDGFGK